MNVQFSEVEESLANNFRQKHWKKCHSRVRYIINRDGGIGWGVTIKCRKCKKTKNITDVGCW